MANRFSAFLLFLQQQYRFLAKIVFPIVKKNTNIVLTGLIFANAVYVLYLTYTHNPNFEFDESNTVRIAQQSISDINEILSYEQNFPFYYQAVHIISNSIDIKEEIAGKVVNYIAWMTSLVTIYFILKSLIQKRTWILFGTLLWASTPLLHYYAYFFRMYALFYTIINLQILLLIQMQKKQSWSHHLLFIISNCLIAKIHPSAIIVIPILLSIYFWIIPKNWIIKLVATITPLLLLINEALQKKDIYLTYLGQGVLYIKNTATPFYWSPSLLLYTEDLTLAASFYVVVAILFYSMIKRKFWQEKKLLPISIFVVIFVVFHLTSKTFVNSRHYIFFTTPLLIFITYALSQLSKKHQLLLSSAIIFYYLSINYGNLLFFHYKEKNYTTICNIVKQTTDAKIYLDWGTLNGVEYCNNNKNKIAFLAPEKPIETDYYSRKEVIIQQVKLGGLYWFRNAGINGLTDELISFATKLSEEPQGQNIMLIKDYHYNPYLTAQEVEALRQLTYIEYKDPSIFIFKKTHQ